MIEAARKRLPALPFTLAGIDTWDTAERFDLILANAVLQWLPHHESLMPRLLSKVAAAGSLAVQVPDNLDEPGTCLMRQIAATPGWRAKLATATAARAERQGAEWYYQLLGPHAARVDVWRTTYHHVLKGGTDAVVEWFKGSGLRPFLAPLDPGETDRLPGRVPSRAGRRLQAAAGWHRAAAVPQAVHRRDALTGTEGARVSLEWSAVVCMTAIVSASLFGWNWRRASSAARQVSGVNAQPAGNNRVVHPGIRPHIWGLPQPDPIDARDRHRCFPA